MGLWDKLKTGLSKAKQILNTDVRDLLKHGEILTEDQLEEFYARLIRTDMGVVSANAIREELREKHLGRTVVFDEVWKTIKDKLRSLLKGDSSNLWDPTNPVSPLQFAETGPTVILVAGVNGVGKTTSIAKLTNLLVKSGRKVVLAAGDTFRAAAVDQLMLWAKRLNCEIVTKPPASDPAAVAHAGCTRALEVGADVLIIDTAGRIQTQVNLMKQLEKIQRVIGSQIPGAPHEVILVLDATTGQNGVSQAQHFAQVVRCTGMILAKLDGTAKGGIVLAIRQMMSLPVKYVGLGEQVDDLEVFNADGFVEALFEK